MKIRKKLLLVFVGLGSLVSVVGYFAINNLVEITKAVNQIKQSSILEMESSTAMSFEMIQLNGLFKDYIYEITNIHPDETASLKKKIQAGFVRFEKALESRKTITASGLHLYKAKELEQEKEELKTTEYLGSKYRKYKESILEIMASYEKTGQVPKYRRSENHWEGMDSVLIEELNLFRKDSQEEITSETAEVIHDARNSTNSMIVIACLALLLAIVAGIFIAKSIVTPILQLNVAAQNIALGNMNTIQSITSGDEIGDLAASFNRMAIDLKISRTRIEEYSKTLEQKVTERTGELEETIKKLKHTEEILKSYAGELKRSNSELEQFAYVASHDLQEPLRTITSFVKLFQGQYKGKLDVRADQYLAFITEASNRMQLLISDLLEYSRIGAKKELRPVDTHLILQEVLVDVGTAIKEAGAEISVGQLPVISGYRTEIKQLFQNLIMNSIKFRKRQTIPLIHIEGKLKDSSWEFTFADNGIGIAQQYREKIFVIFQRLHTRKEYPGSGIGLSHCKKIVELHNGKIRVESTIGEGSIFYFNIPQKNVL